MKVNGTATLHAPVDEVWTALRDPNVLVRTIPGCVRLETVGEDEYAMTVTAGVASIKGTYVGTVRLTDPEPPHSFVLRASGNGNPGTVDASVTVSLTGDGGGSTRLEYDADAVVGGTIAGVGQRMLSSAAKRTAGEFFTNVDAIMTGGWPEEHERPGAAPPATGRSAPSASRAEVPAGVEPPAGVEASAGAVYEAPPRQARAPSSGDFAKGAAFGAAIALAGVIVGAVLGRRSGAGTRVLAPDVRVRAPRRRC